MVSEQKEDVLLITGDRRQILAYVPSRQKYLRFGMMPRSRMDGCGMAFAGGLFLIGNTGNFKTDSDDRWVNVADLPKEEDASAERARLRVACVVANACIYTFWHSDRAVMKYDIESDHWYRVANLFSSSSFNNRCKYAIAAWRDWIFVIEGETVGKFCTTREVGGWKMMPSLPKNNYYSCSAAVVFDQLFAFGFCQAREGDAYYCAKLNLLDESEGWKTIASPPVPVDSWRSRPELYAITTIDHMVYLVLQPVWVDDEGYSFLMSYDTETDKWKKEPEPPMLLKERSTTMVTARLPTKYVDKLPDPDISSGFYF